MSPQAGWILQEEVMPRLRSSIPKAVVCVGAEDPQELIQDATVLAAKMIDRLEQRGKLDKVTPGNIAYYTVQHSAKRHLKTSLHGRGDSGVREQRRRLRAPRHNQSRQRRPSDTSNTEPRLANIHGESKQARNPAGRMPGQRSGS